MKRHSCQRLSVAFALGATALGLAARAADDKKLSDEIIQLSPFTVSTTADDLYKPKSSVSTGLINQLVIDSPLSLVALTSQTFSTDLKIADLSEVQNTSAALGQSTGARGFGAQFATRGVPTETFNNGHRTRQFMDNATIDRIEVVNGPMATLYGESAGSGVVAVTTKQADPTKAFGQIGITIGDEHLQRGVLDFNTPFRFRDNPAALRFIYYNSSSDSHLMRWYEKKAGAYLAVNFRPFARTIVDVRGDWLISTKPNYQMVNVLNNAVDKDGDGRLGFDFPNNLGAGPWWMGIAKNGLWQWTQGIVSTDIVTNVTKDFTVRFSGLYLSQWLTSGVTGPTTDRVYANRAGAPTIVRVHDGRERDTKSAKLDLLYNWRLNSVGVGGKLLAGAELYRTSDRESYNAYNIPNPGLQWGYGSTELPSKNTLLTTGTLNAGSSRPYSDQTNFSRAQRLTSLIDLFDQRVRLVGGYRRNTGAFEQNQNPVTGAPPYSGNPYKWTQFDQPTWQYGASIDVLKKSPGRKFVDQLAVYYSNGTTFVPPRQGNVAGTPELRPETGKGYEIGLKGEFLRGKLSADAAFFSLQRDGTLQSVAGILGAPSWYANIGNQEVSGWQFQGNFAPFKGWNNTVQFMRITGRVTRDVNIANIGLPTNVPDKKVTSWSKYSFREGALHGFSLGVGYVYVGNYPVNNYTRTQEDYVLPSYALLNAMTSYDFKLAGMNLTATLNVDNVLNRLYMDRSGGTEFMTGAPRNWRFSMDYRF